MLGSGGRRGIRNDAAVQRAGDNGITQGISDLRDLQRAQRQLIHSGRRYIQFIAVIACGQIILTVKRSAICVCCKVPGSFSGSTPAVIGEELPFEDSALERAVALGCGGVFIHLSQYKGRIEDGNIGYGDNVLSIRNGMGVGSGIQLETRGCFGFPNGQHIPDVIVLGRNRIAVSIRGNGFYCLTVKGHGILRTGQGVQRIVLDLRYTGSRRIDGLF